MVSRRDRVVQSLCVAAVIGGINLWKNGVNWGNGIAAVFVFCVWFALGSVRNRLAHRRGRLNR
ncbi:hypothetical protein [Actinacidiphila alni]|uniref:hypothetical protein n=1 Tax=Actinacidiphila alni TaxID=380248 RepID=UPI0034572222